VGIAITKKAGLKRITLELGSNSAVIVDKDCESNLSQIVSRCVFGSFANAGQVCISIQRIYVHKEIKEKFITLFVEETKKLKLGNPLLPDVDVGPMITIGEARRAKNWIDEATSKGAKILIGGNHNNTLFEPTVLTDVSPEMKVVAQEIFAPVVSIIEFENWDQVIDSVNYSKYGLHAGVYTQDVKRAFYAAQNLEVGGVIINDIPTYRADHIPYGGVKESGIGKEGVKYAIEEMTQIKFVCFNNK
jgi:acyl-CoA reductase-like NAD-dependent aldehyde dehydrogenase